MTTTSLKLLALILMFLDHIGEFIPGMPVYLRWIGRLSAPLFMFCMVWGLHYTRNRMHYLKRMYFFGVFMAAVNLLLNNILSEPYHYISNNIFVTLLLVGIIVTISEKAKERPDKRIFMWTCFFAFEFFSTIICILLGSFAPLYGISSFVGAILPNLIFSEGSFIFVALGVLMYHQKESKRGLITVYVAFIVIYTFITTFAMSQAYGITDYVHFFLHENYQWMMIFSLPLMLGYNNQKGAGLKYFFYIFYPAHIILLYLAGNLLF
ncbi:MAG: conjugal transfer protein TraX [Lachnospiraceae bacterium]|nr:conjugal transfer protein TraX [Lachnospiraceae bacterium]